MRWWRALPLAVTLLTAGATALTLARHPFAQPLVALPLAEAGARIETALMRAATPERLAAEVAAAIEARDLDRLEMAVTLADDQGIALPRPLMERALVVAQEEEGTASRLADCAACAWDPAACRRAADIARCALPVELTPIGDLRALMGALEDHAAGRPADRLEIALALAGLGGTAALLVTAGGGALVKAGASALRLARRVGGLRPGLRADLERLADLGITRQGLEAVLRREMPLDRLADPARLAALTALAGDLGLVARHLPPGQAIRAIGRLDSAAEARHLARLAQAAGARSPAALHYLGKTRAFRLAYKLTEGALAALALIAGLALQLALWLLWAAIRAIALLRRLVHAPPR